MPEDKPKPTMLTGRFEEALVYATQLHAGQNRKRSYVPYVAHLLAVTALVLEDGGDEDQAIAALLHDAVEDQGGLATLEEIRKRFGEYVAAIVVGCTDAFSIPKPPWRQRKEKYIASLRHADPAVRRVSLADKVHNARSTLRDLTREGETVWARFNGGKEGTLWYYHELIDAFEGFGSTYLLEVFKRTVSEIERLSSEK
jgi:(p)ppGpp synthase/HD superfamily hydrolase